MKPTASTASNAVIAANRFGLGARPGELHDLQDDPRGGLQQQIKGDRPTPAAIGELPDSASVFKTYLEGIAERREQRSEARTEAPAMADKPATNSEAALAAKVVNVLRQKIGPIYLAQVGARYAAAAQSQESFRERLVHFWTNHFAVSADKPIVIGLAATLENEAIRPNLDKHFIDLVLAAESHPAMILYLDNQASIGPHSKLANYAERRGTGNRKLDINENLAREIMELHTLGVNGGYTQSDVTTFAEVLTGWSVGGSRGRLNQGEPGKFFFRENAHEPGAKTILGKRYGEDGIAQPRAVLADLAQHTATANHIATKLVRHFVGDSPPPAAVARLAKVFRDTHGDLPSLHRALVELPEAWNPEPAKFKTPHEFVVSAYRMIDFVPQTPQQVLVPFQLLGQRPYTPGSPAGWPDTAEHWDGPDALLKRIEWSTAFGARVGTKYSTLQLADVAIGTTLSDHTRAAISRAASGAQGATLLLASPEFMRR